MRQNEYDNIAALNVETLQHSFFYTIWLFEGLYHKSAAGLHSIFQ